MNVEFNHLIMSYGEKTVLDIPEGLIQSGSRTAVTGPNGAGKSTLAHIVAGLARPASGKVYYGSGNGEWADRSAVISQREVTMVTQRPYLISDTVEKNIAYPLRLRGAGREETRLRVDELCRELGLSSLRKQKSWKLSGGERQKTALARALSFRPRLLLLDEPTANIDVASTGEIERMLRKINEEDGTTIVLITHNLAQVRRVCTHLIFLNRGEIIESGGCAEMLRSPKKELTRRFIAGELLL